MIRHLSNQAWVEAKRELDRWTDEGLSAQFWVRDDDAIAVTNQLERLREFSAKRKIQIGLAVIPGSTVPQLVDYLAVTGCQFYPMCHGWRHVNHSRSNKPAEFGRDRPTSRLIEDARSGLATFSSLFQGKKAFFVPPYNAATTALIKELPHIGYFGVSLMPGRLERRLLQLASRLNWWPAVKMPNYANAPRIDVHLDVINWRTMKAQETEVIIGELLQNLCGRRLGLLAADAPIGILTHHLVHNEGIWSRCDEILDFLQSHSAVSFIDIGKWVDEYSPPSPPQLTVSRAGLPVQ